MANVLMTRTATPSSKSIIDGQLIFDTSGNGKMYLDVGTKRLEMGGAIDIDSTLDATSTNPIQNKGVAGVMLSSLSDIRNTTKAGFLTDALATKALDTAISDVNSKLPYLSNFKLITTINNESYTTTKDCMVCVLIITNDTLYGNLIVTINDIYVYQDQMASSIANLSRLTTCALRKGDTVRVIGSAVSRYSILVYE